MSSNADLQKTSEPLRYFYQRSTPFYSTAYMLTESKMALVFLHQSSARRYRRCSDLLQQDPGRPNRQTQSGGSHEGPTQQARLRRILLIRA
jgi:hypothetical protein